MQGGERSLSRTLHRSNRSQWFYDVGANSAEPVDTILNQLGLPATPPPLPPARGPPQPELAFAADPGFELDQTLAYDLTEPQPVPDFDFDQSAGA
jgi:hypothetical protein